MRSVYMMTSSQKYCQLAESFEGANENNVYVVVDQHMDGLNKCENCVQLEKRLSAMENYFANKMSEVPDELWAIFPERGDYIKNILRFSGYETLEAILKLKHESELTKVFQFIRNVYDVIEDKKSMLGIFENIPEKLTLLPGLEPVLQKFVRSAESLASLRRDKDGDSSEETDYSDNLVSMLKLERRKRQRPNRIIDVESLTTQLLHWVYRNKPPGEFPFLPSDMFNIRSADIYDGFIFLCLNCKATVTLTGPSQGKVSLSNAQRHIKSCWLYGRKVVKKKNISASMVKGDLMGIAASGSYKNENEVENDE